MIHQLPFNITGMTLASHDAAIVVDGEDLQEALKEAVIHNIETDVEITIGDVTMFLAAWLDPEHWSSDWEEKGYEPDEVLDMLESAIVRESSVELS